MDYLSSAPVRPGCVDHGLASRSTIPEAAAAASAVQTDVNPVFILLLLVSW